MLVEEQDLDTIKSENSLVERIRMGQKEAEQELVTQYWRGLYFILQHRTKNPDLAADIAQDTFIVVIQKARSGQILNPEALKTYIRQTGVNLLIGHFRKETRRNTTSVEDIEVHAPTNEMELSHALHSDKIMNIVQQLIDELSSERDKQLLRSYFVYDQNKQQICTELELSAEYFDKVLFRARQRLKQVILSKLGDGQISSNKEITTMLLSVVLVLCSNSNGRISDKHPHFFLISLREYAKQAHLIIETPMTRSRCSGMQFTPKSRCL